MIRQARLFIHTIGNEIRNLRHGKIYCCIAVVGHSILAQERTDHTNHVCKYVTVLLRRAVKQTSHVIGFMLKQILCYSVCRLLIFLVLRDLMQFNKCKPA